MNVYAYVGVLLKLSVGSAYYMITKMITQTCTYDIDHDDRIVHLRLGKVKCPDGMTPFEKPFFVSTVVFASMCLSLIYFVVFRRAQVHPSTYNVKMIKMMFIPSILECVALCMGIYAQILMALSLAMIMKGAKVVFSALFTTTFLKRKQHAFHWFSVSLCVVGLAIAGGSEYLNNRDAGWAVLIGSSLLLASECMKAFHVIYDEMMMKKNNCDVLFVVGTEGVYGVIFLVPTIVLAWLVIPGKDQSRLEHLLDSFHRIGQSEMLTALFSVLPAIVVVLAVAGVMIIKYLTGVHNALISVSRSIVAWGLELVFFYCAPSGFAQTYGKPWGTFSVLRIVGFAMVIVSTLIYDEDIRLPSVFYYPPKTQVCEEVAVDGSEEQKPLDTESIVSRG